MVFFIMWRKVILQFECWQHLMLIKSMVHYFRIVNKFIRLKLFQFWTYVCLQNWYNLLKNCVKLKYQSIVVWQFAEMLHLQIQQEPFTFVAFLLVFNNIHFSKSDCYFTFCKNCIVHLSESLRGNKSMVPEIKKIIRSRC